MTAVKAEAKDFGIPFFCEKYKEPELIFDENNLELVEDILEISDNKELPTQESDSHPNTPDNEEGVTPFHQLIGMIHLAQRESFLLCQVC